MSLTVLLYQAETLSKQGLHNSPVWFRMLALNGQGFTNEDSQHFTLRAFWPNITSKKDLLEQYGGELMSTALMRRSWRWICQVTSQEASIAKTVLHWTPQGKCKRGHSDGQWRRKSRRWGRAREASNLWQSTGRCGGNKLLPYMPLRYKGHG